MKKVVLVIILCTAAVSAVTFVSLAKNEIFDTRNVLSVSAAGIKSMIVCAAGVCGVFSEEVSLDTRSVILASREGRRKLLYGKITASVIYCAETYIFFLLFDLMSYAVYSVIGNPDLPQVMFGGDRIDFIPYFTTVCTVTFLASLLVTLASAAISSVTDSPYASAVITGALFLIPKFLISISASNEYVYKILILFPVNVSQAARGIYSNLTYGEIPIHILIYAIYPALSAVLVLFTIRRGKSCQVT